MAGDFCRVCRHTDLALRARDLEYRIEPMTSPASMMMYWPEVYSTLLDYLLPERCPMCTGPTSRGYCPGCRRDFARVENPCTRCGLTIATRVCPVAVADWPLDRVVAPLVYEYPLTTQIHALKFSGRRSLGHALGLLLADCLRRTDVGGIQALVAVPLHRSRLCGRGYNQALEVARPVAKALQLPLLLFGVQRPVATSPVAELDARERRECVRNAFAVTRDLDGRGIAIIDDVITTGATVSAFANALRDAGAARVEAWAVARAL